jgi:hypothetical protein
VECVNLNEDPAMCGIAQQHQHETRNRCLLHNWQCICVLLASYRANVHSPIRDSILCVMPSVMDFLVLDEWAVERKTKSES